MRKIDLRAKTHEGGDERRLINSPKGGTLVFDRSGLPVVAQKGDNQKYQLEGGLNRLHCETQFDLLTTASSVAAGSDKFLLNTGTTAAVIARASKGGENVKTQASSPSDGDNAFLAGVTNTPFAGIPIGDESLVVFATRVALTSITNVFASFGLNENLTDVDPTGTAGEGAMFVFDSGGEFLDLDADATPAASANWCLAHKVNGADTFEDTGVPVVAGQDYDLMIAIDADMQANFYIDGALVGQGPALTDGDTVGVFMGVELYADGAQKDFSVRYVAVNRAIGS